MRAMLVLAVAGLVACGPDVGGGPDGGGGGVIADPSVSGAWSGTISWQWGEQAPSSYAHTISATVSGEQLVLSKVCYGPPVVANGSMTLQGGAWSGDLECDPFVYTDCGDGMMVITYSSATASIADDVLTVVLQAEGTHCEITEPITVTFTGTKQGG